MVNAFRSDMNLISNKTLINSFIINFLNPIDNCFARRIAYGVGAPLPALGTGSTSIPNTTYPSTFPLGANAANTTLPVVGLNIALIANDNTFNLADFQTITAQFKSQKINYAVISSRGGLQASGVIANTTYLTGGSGTSIFYDAVVVGSLANETAADPYLGYQSYFLREAYTHGKPLISIGNAANTFKNLGYSNSSTLGVFNANTAAEAASFAVTSLGNPGRYPNRVPVDDLAVICGSEAT